MLVVIIRGAMMDMAVVMMLVLDMVIMIVLMMIMLIVMMARHHGRCLTLALILKA